MYFGAKRKYFLHHLHVTKGVTEISVKEVTSSEKHTKVIQAKLWQMTVTSIWRQLTTNKT